MALAAARVAAWVVARAGAVAAVRVAEKMLRAPTSAEGRVEAACGGEMGGAMETSVVGPCVGVGGAMDGALETGAGGGEMGGAMETGACNGVRGAMGGAMGSAMKRVAIGREMWAARSRRASWVGVMGGAMGGVMETGACNGRWAAWRRVRVTGRRAA
jgi:hypothetical protein